LAGRADANVFRSARNGILDFSKMLAIKGPDA